MIPMWMSRDELLAAEAAQRAESGFEAPAELPADLDAAFQRWADAPMRPDWPFVEPATWEEADYPRRPARGSTDGDALRARLRGAWIGRCIGNCAGKPLEAGRGWTPDRLREYLQSVGNYPFADYLEHDPALPHGIPWVGDPGETARGRISAVPRDDDLNYTVLGLRVVERVGRAATTADFAHEWLLTMPYLAACTAERVAYKNLVDGVSPDAAADVRNPYREWVGAVIRADPIGYVFPGDPSGAAEVAWRDAALSHRLNGVYGEVWVAALVAIALASDDVASAVLESLDFVPRGSRLAAELDAVVADWRAGAAPGELVRAVHARHPETDPVHTINNAGVIAAALLSSGNDFDRALATVLEGCWDTDSNGATVGSVVGAVVGIDGVPRRWWEPFQDTLRSDVQGFDGASLVAIADRFHLLAASASRVS